MGSAPPQSSLTAGTSSLTAASPLWQRRLPAAGSRHRCRRSRRSSSRRSSNRRQTRTSSGTTSGGRPPMCPHRRQDQQQAAADRFQRTVDHFGERILGNGLALVGGEFRQAFGQ